ncbi:hypothetical protein LI068_05745 [Peptostreptococcus anaerobius]|uniref:hypothetical protein n=1 Tax=Peptostreptococcus anaerobius TaxID=1261 RepID=UPI001D07DCBD|nr:hypothetical protein [Peptostreptococcus anaerobius]MCB6983121.1 hypothetical protein [Peptostreptococcus anaerobius]MCQ5151075.1 hypothetical protein [Peptostreptococcus anaerobius]
MSGKINNDDKWEVTGETLGYMISRIQERYQESLIEGDDDFNNGRKLAFYEVLDMIKNDLEVRGYSLDDFK